MSIVEINAQAAKQIIESRHPLGKFIATDGRGTYTAIDNTTGEAFTEDFDTRDEAENWLSYAGITTDTRPAAEPDPEIEEAVTELEKQWTAEKDAKTIAREAAARMLEANFAADSDTVSDYHIILDYIENSEPLKFGSWEPTALKGYYTCTNCRCANTTNPNTRYCPYCGATMTGTEAITSE
jgi:rubrerythrin